MDASKFIATARRHALDNPGECPCDPEQYGMALAYLAGLVGQLELDESRTDADLAAASVQQRTALSEGYRQYLRGGSGEQLPPRPAPAPGENNGPATSA